MTTAYWSQWSHTEIMSMHGVELEDVDLEEEVEEHADQEQICCSGCMSCLGVSW